MAAINVYEYRKFLPTLQDIPTGTLIEFLQDNAHWLVYLDASITRQFEPVLHIAPRETRV